MNELQQKQLAFLEDTVKHYNLTNRCANSSGSCRYSPITLRLVGISQGCAIGRHLSISLQVELDKQSFGKSVSNDIVFLKLPDSLQALGRGFLLAVQKLHDKDYNWDYKGISPIGESNVKLIKKEYNLL